MKKFFSLVLALVMALSLTTIAWGAIDSQTNLEAAIPGGGEVILDTNITLSSTLIITNGVTLNLNGKTITGEVEINTTEAVTIKNGSITNAAAGGAGRCIDTRVNANVTIDGVALTTTGSGNTQPLTIGGSTHGTTIVLKNSTIAASQAGYAIISFVKTNLTIQNCNNISGYAAIYMKPDSNGSVVNIEKSTLISNGIAGASNSFSTVVAEDDNVTFKVDKDSTLTATAADAATEQAIFGLGTDAVNPDVSNVKINVADGAVLTGQILAADAENVANNTVTVPAEYADELAAEGYVVTVDANGQVVATGVSASAPAGGTALPTLYDMVTTDIAQTKTLNVTVTTYAAKNPKDTTSPKDGLYDVPGNIKYMVFSNLPGKYFVQVPSVSADADYTVYQAGTQSVLGYFKEIVSPFYLGNGVAFYNFGEICGQYDDTPTVGASYYTFQGDLFVADPTGLSDVNLMVGTNLTPVTLMADADDAGWVTHVAKFTYDKTYKVTAVVCAECGTPAIIYPNYDSVPKADRLAGKAIGPINTDDYYVWQAGPGAVVDTETKVESAETFDAGIAMYVGMSVMAAAGSAVVIGKKKD